jgi:hypothetical protein
MTAAETMSPDLWEACLVETFRIVSDAPACRPILQEIGRIRLQLVVEDRAEMSYWEEYTGDRVTPHLGVCDGPSAEISTVFPVLLATLLNRISIMEAAADEVYELRGDTAVLMKCANILPYVMAAFSRTLARQLPKIERAAS